MQLSLFQITAEEMFQAYYDCRKHKRNTREALEFEVDAEHNLMVLLDEINTLSYKVGPSSVFIIDKPVVREVFAASFRDRIVHHLLINLIGETMEKRFIYDCYACRVGKGTHFGIKRLRRAMEATPKGWVLKMDVSGFFMSIDRAVLWKRLREYLESKLQDPRLDIIMYLVKEIVFNDPTKSCRYLCSKEKWKKLDKGKSLFSAKKGCGLPIGNLTSQVFANFYMSELDHYVKHDLGVRWYGRYVDDFFLVSEDKAFLNDCRKRVEAFVDENLGMKINHRKTYFQRVDKGVKFLGVKIELGHINMARRTLSNFRAAINSVNVMVEDHRPTREETEDVRSRLNSYLGILSHYDTYSIRKDMMESLSPWLKKRLKVNRDIRKVSFC